VKRTLSLLILSLSFQALPARNRLTLQQADGRTVRNVIAIAEVNTFSLNLPARLLPAGEYVIALSGLNSNGEADALSKTIFRVSKK
jgi:hypothetical protein